MAQQNIQVNLQFNANVKQAQQQMKQLQTQLSQLATSQSNTPFGLTPQLKEAQKSAMDLKMALNNAMNVDTGKLNLNKFQSELNRSGKSIQQYAQQLQTLGPAGVKAFQQVAQAVAQADTKMINLSGGAKKLMDTLGNTIRWQLTSSAIHGVMNAISGTLSYAKELDTSLNNIRIVTGKSADQMARFAKEANKMAKELSTTTTKYTDASLIYYQQGLNDKAVKERTDTTVKLANVAGRTAAEVSEWMTAIWNNFDNGSESLEYYADVITKLGASTASSADEIATGLEKFAAVAETVGLSYEYATSALATVTAETRQSAEVVGTAFKTLFARMEGLKLGDTLEDGTDLNQYSLALEKVGINIKDANGELKDMDTILDQTGARWATLNKDQQVALAQSVAGIRQYNQFMALMDNWDVMQKNLDLANSANGALEEQNRIYEESMKASQERMKAAAEELKTLIIGGDDLVPLYNFAGKTLEVITELLEAFGGLKTILLGVAVAITKLYQPQVASFVSQMGIGLGNMYSAAKNGFTGKGFKSDNNFKAQTMGAAVDMANQAGGDEGTLQSRFTKDLAAVDTARIENENKLTESVKQRVDWLRQELEAKQNLVMQSNGAVEKAKQETEKAEEDLKNNDGISSGGLNEVRRVSAAVGSAEAHGEIASTMVGQAQGVTNMSEQSRIAFGDDMSAQLQAMKAELSAADVSTDELSSSFDVAEQAIEEFINKGKNIEEVAAAIDKVNEKLKETGNAAIGNAKEDALMRTADKEGYGKTMDSLSKASAVQEGSSIEVSSSAMKQIDVSGIQNKEDKNILRGLRNRGQALQKEAKLLKDKAKWQQKTKKNDEEYEKALKKNQKAIKQYNKEVSKRAKQMKKDLKDSKKQIKNTKEYENANKKSGKALDNLADKQKDAAKGATAVGEAQKNLSKEAKGLADNLKSGGAGFQHWSDTLSKGIGGLATYAMGVSMLTSSFENLFTAIGKGDATWKDWVSSISSAMMSLTMLIPVISQGVTWVGNLVKVKEQQKVKEEALQKLQTLGMSKTQAEMLLEKKKTAEELAGDKAEAASDIVGAYAENAKNAGKGPAGWAMFAAGLAMIAPIALMVGASAIGGSSAGGKEAKQEDVSKGTENLEAINENQELAQSVTDLTKEYDSLRSSGESTAEVLESMREKIPELIDSYKELGKTLGTSIDTTALERAYEVFEKTGDISLYQAEQKKIDDQIANTKETTARTTTDKASDLVMDAAFKGQGHKDGKNYTFHMGDVGLEGNKEAEVQQIFKEELGDMWKKDGNGAGGQFTIKDYENEGELIDAYNKMLAARDRLVKAGLEDSDYYTELNGEIQQMAENMPDLINAHEELFNIEKEKALLDEKKFNANMGLDQVSSTEDYIKVRDKLIAKLKEEKQWTDSQAEAYLAASTAYGKYEETFDMFGEGGMAQFSEDAAEEEIAEIKEWFANLSEEDRTLAMSIDYTVVGSVEEAEAALEEAREKMRIAAATKEATDLGADADTFQTYTEILQLTNEHLKDDAAAAAEVAAANFKVNKGLEDLNKNWSDNLKKIKKNTKGSYEYAEGIASITKSLETMFGVKPSVNFVETHLQDIEDMLNGDREAFEGLQNDLAEDYVSNMIVEPEVVFTGNENAIAQEAGVIQDALQGALNELGDLEIGENVVLSEKYTKVLQDALDAGQITQQQLEEAFKIKGYDLNFKTKQVPGPKTHYKRTYQVGPVPVVVEYDEETEMTVPLINDADATVEGGGDGGSSEATLTATRTADSTTLDTTTLQENADKKEDRLEDLDDELDRYHEINEVISDTERKLDRLGRAKDRAFGASKIALMEQEIAAQKELISNNEKLLEEAETNYETDRQDLLDNYGVELDKDGRITNYQDVQQEYVDRLKAAAGNEDLYNEINEEYEAFKDAASKYEESLNKVEETAENLDSQLDELYDKNLSLIEYKVQIKVDIADDDQAYIDFLMQKTEDDAFAAAENIGFLGESAQNTLDKIAATQDGIKDVERALAAGEITPEQAAEKLRTYRQDLIDYNADLLEIRNSVQEKLTEAYDAWNEKMDTNSAKIEHLTSVTESYKNIIDIVGKDTLGMSDEAMKKLTDTQVNNANNALKASKAKLDANEAFLEDLKKKRAEAVAKYGEDSDEVADWDDQIEYAEEQVMSAKEEFMGSWETALTAAADAFQQHVEQIVETFSESMGGVYKNLEELQEAFDRQTEVNDRYLQQYEKTYEISKLNRSIQDSIDKTDNVASQKEMRKLQQELLDMQADGVNVSKRDIEYMQKKYDLLVAEQALKDAQNAKSVVRLTRDSEGNFGYTYTADQDSVDKAQQNYEDKLYAMQQFGDESLREIQEQILATNQEFKEALEAIAADETLSLEEKEAKVAEVTEYYTGKLRYWTEEADKFMQHGHEMNTEYNAGMAENFNETLLGKMYPDLTSFEGYYTAGFEAMDQAGSDFTEALEGYQGRIDTAFQLAGEDVSTFAEDVAGEGGYLDQVNDKSDEAGGEAERLADRMKEALTGENGATNAIAEFYEEYSQKMADARKDTDDTINKVNELIQKYNELANAESNSGGSGGGGGGDKSGSGSGTVGGSVDYGNNGGTTPAPTVTTNNDKQTKARAKETVNNKRDYVWFDGSYYSRGTSSDEAWSNFKSGQSEDTSGMIKHDSTTVNRLKKLWDVLSADKGIELTRDADIYQDYQQAKGGLLTAGKAIEHFWAANPNVNVVDLVYDKKDYWAKVKITQDAIGFNYKYGSDKEKDMSNGQQFWIKVKDLNIGGSTDYYNPSSYDTGGYTGKWGPEGRMAMLHQKEIVLNAHDTENFLMAIEMVRAMSDRLELNARLAQLAMGSLNSNVTVNPTKEALEQQVHITAEFPNATDHNEIEEAFKNLTNLASQYANRK